MKDKSSELEFDVLEVYSDGACSGNPGQGGYGFVIRYLSDSTGEGDFTEKIVDGSAGYRHTTNNRMEMKGALEGLRSLLTMFDGFIREGTEGHREFKHIKVVSDSSYLCSGFTKGWVRKWQRSGWLTNTGQPVKNVDLWEEISNLLETAKKKYNLQYRFVHVPGHKGYIFNERCDKLAVAARQSNNLLVDQVYENIVRKGGKGGN